ncbi:sensor histidine kinase [Pseudoalteromonas luteoviolacea]|uniref:histidine kinase n=1 Tax=Pseudoalteromonas luteoviolacea H33 TaxID=1365251 RepID=A0A161YAG9_9GAMM|nr:HAMP domain-containing sensor histidine kinase [Pseudoalteromonas luteoviolacea]KZN54203.1 histidine kinase [Pseudoalteromonas luteoviolacea H33]KZN78266.1 histidine kinase [Pseudoalteromonas luteoviolacea H33-S]MBQ4877479.1 HAMP domain-containing histidine kinase [Pseudoalteromonas luteoviolacea]MBQ4906422.1 HAMP domain-containing histidine kinase [Pseudoalteromonas luteoviolacea]
MTFSLYHRLALVITGVFMLTVSAFVYWTQNLSSISRAQAEQQLHLGLAEHLAQDNPLLKQGVYDYKALENLFHTLMVLGPAFEFYFVDPSGKLLTFSAKPGEVKRQSIDLRPLIQLINEPTKLPIYGDDPRSVEQNKIFSVSPVYNGDKLQGYLYVIIGSSIADSISAHIKSSEQLAQSIAWLIAMAIFLFAILLLLFRTMTRPLKRLSQFIQKVEKNDFDMQSINPLTWSSKYNEIHVVGQSVNSMLETINQQMTQLTAIDEQRRKLLAHLSHDLRTPLASLQGYLELIEKNPPTGNNEQEYLAISLKNCNQLKSLIDQIFELAHLESGQSKVNFEVFNLGELIYDVLAKFALKAQKADISLSVYPVECDFTVYSDIAKLERILSNLIENALRHTPAKGSICISICATEKAYSIAVQDTGVGISPKELPYIFEARYQASNTRGCKKSHAGLGLAITARLIELIKSEIKVNSRLGQGSEFVFQVRGAEGSL